MSQSDSGKKGAIRGTSCMQVADCSSTTDNFQTYSSDGIGLGPMLE